MLSEKQCTLRMPRKLLQELVYRDFLDEEDEEENILDEEEDLNFDDREDEEQEK